MSIRHRRTLRTAGLLTTLAIALAGLSAVASAQSPAAPNDATIAIGSLYEPQNLDNTAGGGQGVTEAFNGNVYEGLFKLTDDGKVEPLLANEVQVQRRRPHLHLHPARRREVPLRQGADLADVKCSIERVIAADSQSARKSQLRRHLEASTTPDDKTVVVTLKTPLDLVRRTTSATSGSMNPDADDLQDHRGRHRPVQARHVEARQLAEPRALERLLGHAGEEQGGRVRLLHRRHRPLATRC